MITSDSKSLQLGNRNPEITSPLLNVIFTYLTRLRMDREIVLFDEELKDLGFIKKEIRKVTPIDDFRFANGINSDFERISHKTGSGYLDNLRLEFKIGDDWFRWNDLSDGTKRIFLLIWRISSTKVKQILIEEPEIGVHPKQLGKLMTVLKEYSQYKQIILTTHSPDVLDVLTIDELDRIFVCKLNDEGTKLYKLDEKRRLKAKRYMQEVDYLSSYWRMSDLENVEV